MIGHIEEIIFLQVEPTTKCNFSCGFCCGRYMKQINLNMDIYKKCIDSLPELKYLELQGEGEPFLCPDIFDMIKYAKDRNIEVSTITNGSMFTGKNIEQMIESRLDHISVSIESTDAERFKKIRGGNISELLEGIENLVKAKKKFGSSLPHISFSVTVLKEESENIDDIFELYRKLNLDSGIMIQFLNASSDYKECYNDQMVNNIMDEMEKKRIYRKYYKFMAKNNLLGSNHVHFFERLQQNNESGEQNKLCNWLKRALYMKADGSIAPCVYSKKDNLGSIEEGISVIHERRKDLLQKFADGGYPEMCMKIGCGVFSL